MIDPFNELEVDNIIGRDKGTYYMSGCFKITPDKARIIFPFKSLNIKKVYTLSVGMETHLQFKRNEYEEYYSLDLIEISSLVNKVISRLKLIDADKLSTFELKYNETIQMINEIFKELYLNISKEDKNRIITILKTITKDIGSVNKEKENSLSEKLKMEVEYVSRVSN